MNIHKLVNYWQEIKKTKMKSFHKIVFILLILLATKLDLVESKGGAVIGGSAGGGQVCLECNPGGNYTQEEMRVALFILIIILCIFFALCSCQCYNRMKYECNERTVYNMKNGSVPEAPYFRDSKISNFGLNGNLTAALMSANSTSEIILPFTSHYNNV